MQARETSPGYTGGGGPPGQQLRCDNLQNLPHELLQMVLKDVPHKFHLRSTCKAFSSALASCCDSILLNRAGLASHGPRSAVSSALNAFPNARCVIINLESRLYDFARANAVLNVQSDFSSGPIEERTRSPIPSSHCSGSSASSSFEFFSITSPNANVNLSKDEEEEVLLQTLSALRGHIITSLAIISLSCTSPSPSALNHMRFTLLHLELSSTSYEAALEQGAVNILLRDPQALCARSDAIIQLAVSLPLLRTLSISTAAFSASSVVALTGLSKLESLSLVGCMDCPGGTAQAAEIYRRLLLALPALRQLRLPMAVAVTVTSSSAALRDDEDEDQNAGDSWDGGEGIGAGLDSGGDGGDGDGGLRTGSGEDSGASSEPVSYGDGGSAGIGSSPHGTPVGPKWTAGYESMPGSTSSSNAYARTSRFRSEPALAPVIETGSQSPVRLVMTQSKMEKTNRFPPQTTRDDGDGSISGGSRGAAFFCTTAVAAAAPAAAAATPRKRPERRQRTSQPGFKYSFPPRLRDLTIPLCSLNRPIFKAVCAAYGCDGEGDVEGNGAECSCDCAAAISRSYSPPAASAFDVMHGVGNVDGIAMRGTRSSSGGGSNSLRSLHIATLGGYSHWEGSFLKTTHDFEMLARLRNLTTLHLSIDLGTLKVNSHTMQHCFQELMFLQNLKDLRVSEAQPPACFSIRNPLSSSHQPFVFGSLLAAAAAAEDAGAPSSPSPPSLPLLMMPPSTSSPPPPPPPPPPQQLLPLPTKAPAMAIARGSELPSAALLLLQRQWPHLTTLQFFSETTVRGNDGQLLVSPGTSDVSLLPPPCACCTAPCLMAMKKPMAGRWDRVEYGNLCFDLDNPGMREKACV